ncbi:MAG: Lrp/AsnC family transcriptional regulator, regulator for asnA, asnC and gidA [Chloroflexi bacterium]|jgi:Lrp/AsnC family transcriptional regulator for asnA, asnC and gidA|nr:MAG: Lrp/AsnC family transcriptional regulator, regulator for asnA, asnC and gidA [Chloroflexota bacterium]
MDELDRKIIGILQQDGRASNAKIARQLGVSEGTIRRRLKRLIEDEAIQVLALPEPSKLGYGTEAIVGLQVDPGKIEDVAAALASVPEALNVSVTTGAFDLFAWVALPSSEELHSFLLAVVGNIQGVRRSETFVIMSVKKRTFSPVS